MRENRTHINSSNLHNIILIIIFAPYNIILGRNDFLCPWHIVWRVDIKLWWHVTFGKGHPAHPAHVCLHNTGTCHIEAGIGNLCLTGNPQHRSFGRPWWLPDYFMLVEGRVKIAIEGKEEPDQSPSGFLGGHKHHVWAGVLNTEWQAEALILMW